MNELTNSFIYSFISQIILWLIFFLFDDIIFKNNNHFIPLILTIIILIIYLVIYIKKEKQIIEKHNYARNLFNFYLIGFWLLCNVLFILLLIAYINIYKIDTCYIDDLCSMNFTENYIVFIEIFISGFILIIYNIIKLLKENKIKEDSK